MLSSAQQEILHNLTSQYQPLYLWDEFSFLFGKPPTPATQSFILQIFNSPETYKLISNYLNMPLYPVKQDIVVNVMDHIYVNMVSEKDIFFGSIPVTYEVDGIRGKPTMYLKWTLSKCIPELFISAKRFLWISDFCLTGKAQAISADLLQKTDNFIAQIVQKHTLEEVQKDFEDAATHMVLVVLLSSVLEQYINFFVSQKYQYSWDDIAIYYQKKYLDQNLFLQTQQFLKKVGNHEATIQDYLQKFGSYGVVDYELSSPRLAEMPMINMQEIVEKMKHIPSEAELQRAVTLPNFSTFEQKLLESYWLMIATRGTIRVKAMVIIAHMRNIILQFAKTNNIDSQLVFFLRKDEMLNKPAAFLQTAEERRKVYMENSPTQLPQLLTGEIVTNLLAKYSIGGTIQAIPISPGSVTAKIRTIRQPNELIPEGKDTVLVFPDASTLYSKYFAHAAGIVFEKGGATSHAAIVAREYKVPAISLGGQSLGWEDGTVVALDGEKGNLQAV